MINENNEKVENVETQDNQGKVITEKVESSDIINDDEVIEAELSGMEEELIAKSNNIPTLSFSNDSNKTQNFALIRDTARHINDMTQIANVIIKSKLSPLKNANDVILAIITGNQYNLPFMASIANIYPINGRPSMGTHIIRGLILRNKIMFTKIYDYEPMFEYAKAKKVEDKLVVVTRTIKVNNVDKQVPVILGTFTTKDAPQELHIKGDVSIDRITKYQFKRKVKQIDGSYEDLVIYAEYKISDARTAGFLDKDNWINHPARMLDARAFNIGAREIADDILLGMMSISELADEYNTPYTIDATLQERVKN
jgi:hypothetical protein